MLEKIAYVNLNGKEIENWSIFGIIYIVNTFVIVGSKNAHI